MQNVKTFTLCSCFGVFDVFCSVLVWGKEDIGYCYHSSLVMVIVISHQDWEWNNIDLIFVKFGVDLININKIKL